MPKQLTAHNATITTATIQVRALTIGARQVTLAVFRQLREEDILHPLDATITGTPWGTVNYHPDKCADAPEHLHIVWQKGDELRRSTIQTPHAGHHTHPAAGLYVRARIIHRTAHRPFSEPGQGDTLRLSEVIPGGRRFFLGGRFTHGGMAFEGGLPVSLREAWRTGESPSAGDLETFEEAAFCLGIPDVTSLDQVEKELLSMLPTDQYRESWAELLDLPQLFIAV